ncbi:MAG: pyridine nucleotide-disulfide oxidoreductase, partial [Candidatus Kapaibacterium sp.]
VRRLTPTIVELIVHAPYAARKFQPGEFYRLQNYERYVETVNGQQLVMEGLAMTGASTDPERGLLSMIALEMGSSSRLISRLQPGERVVVMGPTGAPTHIPANENVMLCGGGLGNAVLFSISKALRASGCRVLYFAGYKNGSDVFKMDDIEASTDQVIWCSDVGEEIAPRRPQDRHIRANIIEAMRAYHEGRLGEQSMTFPTVHRVIAIGSDGMMNAVRLARHTMFKDALAGAAAIGSINSPMQCMMKEICAQCLQKHVDPVTGEETAPVFSCFNQDQDLDRVDFANLKDRLRVNSVLEKLGNSWLTHMLSYE